MASRYAPIEDYGIIGDLHTVALVGKDGSIDFLCLPSFDSPSVFAALLDAERGGRFQIAPQLGEAARKQLYLPDTNVLLTRFLSNDGVAELSDFMPVEDAGRAHNLVRRVKTVRGEIRFRMRCDPRFDYARATHSVERRSDREVVFIGRAGAGELALRLCSSVAMQLADGAAVAEFTLGADESASFVLEVVMLDESSPGRQQDYDSEAFKQTVNFWRRWIDRCTSGCPRTSAASGTGTTATPGSATRPSSSTASCGSATPARRKRSCAGSWRGSMSWSRTARSRSCTASTAATRSPRRRCRTSRGTWARARFASATPRLRIFSSTSTAS